MVASWFATTPIGVGTHAGPQSWDLFARIGADREGTKIKVSGSARRAPAGILAFGCYESHFCRNLPVSQRGDAHFECVALLEIPREILSQVKAQPNVVDVHQ